MHLNKYDIPIPGMDLYPAECEALTWPQRYETQLVCCRYGSSRFSKFMSERYWRPTELPETEWRRRRKHFGVRGGGYVFMLHRNFRHNPYHIKVWRKDVPGRR